MTQAKRRVTKFDFENAMLSGNKAHVALVDEAANQTEVLLMKSRYETTTTEVEEYGDNGEYSRDTHSVNVADYGGDTVYVTERLVRVVETPVPKVNIVN